MEWIQGALGLISGGVLWECFKFFYPDIKKWIGNKGDAKRIFYKNINPILKSADELLGKIHSLARSDFISLRQKGLREEHDLIYVMYLFANFWGRLMILKIEGDFISLGQISKGKELLKFVTTYEARKNRIIDRSLQRTYGESLMKINGDKNRLKTLFEFTEDYNNPETGIKDLFEPLKQMLIDTGPIETRQKILQFGIIIHALIDHFDPKHLVIRDRVPYVNKLNSKTKKSLRFRVFKKYLDFVMHHNKYYL